MKVVVTGSAGFVGRALVTRLRDQAHDVLGVDRAADADIRGDIGDPAVLARLFATGCDAIVHLATMPGGAAERDPAGARRINLDASMALADAAAAAGHRPRFIFASSIAVLGDPLPPQVDDETPLAPRLIYGAHKAMIEQWLATMDRRGALSALSVRLPGIVARPEGPSGMKSAFLSEIFHALAAGRPFTAPVSPQATMWLMSVDRAVANLTHALAIDASGALTLPALRMSFAELATEIARQTGGDTTRISYDPDPVLEAGFGRQPPLFTSAADQLGFAHDGSLTTLVAKGLNR